MTTDELKQLLDNAANGMEEVQIIINTDLLTRMSNLLAKVEEDQIFLDILLTLLQAANPNVTLDILKSDIDLFSRLVKNLNTLESSGDINKLINLCRGLESRTILLAILAKFI